MSFRHNACAFLIGFKDPSTGSFVDAGVFSEFPVEEPGVGKFREQKLLLSMGSNDYPTAKMLLKRELGRRRDLEWVHTMRTMRLQKEDERW